MATRNTNPRALGRLHVRLKVTYLRARVNLPQTSTQSPWRDGSGTRGGGVFRSWRTGLCRHCFPGPSYILINDHACFSSLIIVKICRCSAPVPMGTFNVTVCFGSIFPLLIPVP